MPRSVRLALLRSLYGTLSVYVGGVIATLSVSIILAVRIGTPLFYVWAALELLNAAARLPVLLACRRAIARGEPGPVNAYVILSLFWASGVGFGALIAMNSQDWIAALVACVSSAAMLGGICFRYYTTPRLVIAMLMAMFLPVAVACLLSGEAVLLVTALLIPIYVVAMAGAALTLNRTVVKVLCAEREERRRARLDPLTGLGNRTAVSEAFARLPADQPLACFYLDLDGFKRVNDTLGHQAGDRLLIMVAKRLRGATPANAILARPGGDEFLILCRCADASEAAQIGDRLVAAIAGQPYIIEEQGVFIGASVGAALRAQHSFEGLVAAADDALYRAKASAEFGCIVANEAAPDEQLEPPILRAFG